MIVYSLILIGWILTGLLAYAICLYSNTERFPYFNNITDALIAFCFGPISLIAELVLIFEDADYYKFGLRFIPYSREQRWKIYQKTYSYISDNPNAKSRFYRRYR
jgi:hypothetical protein